MAFEPCILQRKSTFKMHGTNLTLPAAVILYCFTHHRVAYARDWTLPIRLGGYHWISRSNSFIVH